MAQTEDPPASRETTMDDGILVEPDQTGTKSPFDPLNCPFDYVGLSDLYQISQKIARSSKAHPDFLVQLRKVFRTMSDPAIFNMNVYHPAWVNSDPRNHSGKYNYFPLIRIVVVADCAYALHFMLSHGANPDFAVHNGIAISLVDRACYYESLDCLYILLKFGANPQVREQRRRFELQESHRSERRIDWLKTPIHEQMLYDPMWNCIYAKQWNVLRVLLQFESCDRTIRNEEGLTLKDYFEIIPLPKEAEDIRELL